MRLSQPIPILFAGIFGATNAAATECPNVVFILTDDQSYGDLACHGNTVIQTPNLDRLSVMQILF